MRNKLLQKTMLLLGFMLVSAMTYAQSRSITGKVVDENMQPLPGATVAIPGTGNGTTTDVNGAYTLKISQAGDYQVTASFVGYISVTSQITVKNDNVTLNFNLQPSAKNLNEIVVIGYGTSKKKDLSGSIATVSSKDFQTGNITTPEQLIQGKVAGVSITSNSGAPGAGSTIRIRGGASLNASNDPLIVIDGVQLSNDAIPGAPNPLSLINPNDIESFSILKDASATAIYGSRASNGVILITTKKGHSGKPEVNINTQVSVSYNPKEGSVLTGDQMRDYIKANGSPALIALLGTANTDWQKQIYQTAVSNDNNVSISGGPKFLPYRISAGYLDQKGILKTGYLDRSSLGVNLSPKLFNNDLKIEISLKGAETKTRYANNDAIGAAYSFDPTKPVYSGNSNFGGYWEWLDATSVSGLKALSPKNPLGLLMQKTDKGTVDRAITNAQFDYRVHFLPDLHINANIGYDYSNGRGTVVIPTSAAATYQRYKDAAGVLHSGTNTQYKTTMANTTFEGYLNYTKDIASIKSHIEAVAGYAYYDYLTTTYNFPDRTYDMTVVSSPAFPFDKPEHRLQSFYGRLNYTYDDKYILTGTVRRDGSSRFSPLNKYAVFPSGAFAWRLKEENFLKDSKTISDLKLRVGYGTTGQQDGLDNYGYTSLYALSFPTAEYQLGNSFYQLYRPSAYDPKRKWEQSATTNLGIDYGFLNNRITGSIDAYYKNTKDLLGQVNIAAGSGFSNTFVTNVGNMVNRGIEFNINGALIQRDDFSWNAAFNLTYNESKITKLTFFPNPLSPGNAVGKINGGTGTMAQINTVGYAPNAFYVYQQVYDANGKPIDGVFVDRNGDGTINTSDLYRYKSPMPKYFMGFSTNVTYKQWTAGVVLRASLGNYAYNNVASSTGTQNNIINPLGYINNGSTDVLTTGFSGKSDKTILSDYYVQNASFLKMDNASIGYNFGKILKGTANFSLNANVQNVFTITKYKGVDPEISTGLDNNLYPRPRTFVLGANIKF